MVYNEKYMPIDTHKEVCNEIDTTYKLEQFVMKMKNTESNINLWWLRFENADKNKDTKA